MAPLPVGTRVYLYYIDERLREYHVTKATDKYYILDHKQRVPIGEDVPFTVRDADEADAQVVDGEMTAEQFQEQVATGDSLPDEMTAEEYREYILSGAIQVDWAATRKQRRLGSA